MASKQGTLRQAWTSGVQGQSGSVDISLRGIIVPRSFPAFRVLTCDLLVLPFVSRGTCAHSRAHRRHRLLFPSLGANAAGGSPLRLRPSPSAVCLWATGGVTVHEAAPVYIY